VVRKDLSVRETEDLIRSLKGEKKKPKVSRKSTEDLYLLSLADDLSRHFGTKVVIKQRASQAGLKLNFTAMTI
jgi:hypothetical protein